MSIKVGETYQGWTVISFGQWKVSKYALARHTCGAERKFSIAVLPRNKQVCKKCTARVDFRQDAKIILLNKEYSAYAYSAKKRKYTFDLTKDDFFRLVQSDCHYCGRPPQTVKRIAVARRSEWHKDVLLNGVDRKNSSLGYTKDNVVPCCTTCNFAKRQLSIEEWIAMVELWHSNLDAVKYTAKFGA